MLTILVVAAALVAALVATPLRADAATSSASLS